MKRKILKVFLVCTCYAVLFYSNTAFGIDWEQWRIPNGEQDSSSGGERPAPRREREDTRKREAFKLNEKGNQAYKAAKWQEAIYYYEKALRKSPHDRVIRQNLTNAQITLAGKKANLAYRAGNWEEAIDHYEKALKMSPNNRILRQNLINAQNAFAEEYTRKKKENTRKRKEEARKREAFKLNKKKGNRAYRAGRWKEAIDYYKKALRRFPDDRGIRKNLTNAQNAIAKENTKKEDAFELNSKGIQAYRAGNWKEAIDYYEKALRKFPNDMLIRQNLTNAKNALITTQISGKVQAANQEETAKAIKDLHNSVYWSLKAANAISNNDYNEAREFAEYSVQGYPGGDIELPSVSDVPADPQVRVYKILIKEVNQTTSELKKVNMRLKRIEEKKAELKQEIDLQKTKIEELKQKKSERKIVDKQEEVDGLADAQALREEQEEMDALIAAAQVALGEAEEEDREASKKIVSMNEQKKEQEENLSSLRHVFDTVEKHPGRAEIILKELERAT